MFESMKMATFNGVPIAIYGLSGITLVLLTLLTFKADALAPDKGSDTENKGEEKTDENTPEPAVDEIPEAKVEEVPPPPMAEVVESDEKESTTGGKKHKNKTKRKRNRKKASKTKSKRNKK
jgi:hypothetical protein